jgi:Lrp/AsnC family leucine-responsive transcriptional regulator
MNLIAEASKYDQFRKMDDKDLEILRLVQTNARLTAEMISQDVGLSPPAVQKRLKKLRETGVIEREIAVLSPAKLNREMTIIVDVILERENRTHLDAFKRKMRKAPCVQQCYYTTGEADFLLILTVKDIKEYEQFTQAHFFDESNISRFKTSVVMDRVKVSLDVV